MVDLIAILVTGAMVSSIYALMAIGFTLIFGVGGVLNLAHGAFLMVGAYTFFFLTSAKGLPPLVAFAMGIAVPVVVSLLVYFGSVRFIEEDVLVTAFVTLLLSLVLQEVAVLLFSAQAKSLTPIVAGSIELPGTRIRYYQILGFVVSWASIGVLWFYVTQTKSGRAILATSMSERGALITGVDIGRVKAETWVIAGALAGIGGVFIGTLQQTSPDMWLTPLALAFIIVVVGGIGSIKGSVVGAYLIGFLETTTVALMGPPFRGIMALIVVVIVMLFRPEGLYGREYVE
jgi:branched-chain amino acid transport system permease protein